MSNLPTHIELATMKELASLLVKSGLLPQAIKTPEQAIVIILKAKELNVPPIQAFSSISVVQGRPTISAELMLSLIYKNVPGAIVNFLTTNSEECIIEAKRPGGNITKFRFGMDDARAAGLIDKAPWRAYPASMLRARCISAMAKAIFPDALSGCVYTPEEIGASVDGDGNVIETIPLPIEQAAKESIEIAKEIQRPKEQKMIRASDGVIKAGDRKIEFGSQEKGYLGMTIKEAVDRDGLSKVQNYIQTLIARNEKDGKPVSHQWVQMRDHLNEYGAFLKEELKRITKADVTAPLADRPLTEQEEMHVERMIESERMGASNITGFDSMDVRFDDER